jgi:flavin-binding protein dodecin
MAVVKIIELVGSSKTSTDDAARHVRVAFLIEGTEID